MINGDQHLAPDDATIAAIRFVIDDARHLFYDFDAFGSVIHPETYIQEIANANKPIHGRDVPVGDEPQIVYFTGRREIFKASTTIGEVSASHNPGHSWDGPGGVAIPNVISVDLAFLEPLIFDAAIDRIIMLVRYFELLIGRQQNVLDVGLTVTTGDMRHRWLQVDWSLAPVRKVETKEHAPHPADVLIDTIKDRATFENILTAWMDRDEEWRQGRERFSNSFNQRHRYNVDRLVAAANMFDILPDSSFPSLIPLSADLKAAQEKARALFKALPQSQDRDSVLGALGRLGKLSLKKKIATCVRQITQRVADKFPELDLVTEEAVNCRNFFVHGGDQRFDYDANLRVIWFFVDTLEFVFGASDLVEAGWDIRKWVSKGTTMSHPFGKYKIGYRANLNRLKELLLPTAAQP